MSPAQLSLQAPQQQRREHRLGWHYDDLSDFEFRLVVPGRAIVKKNNISVWSISGRASMGPNSKYSRWERAAVAHLLAQWTPIFAGPIPKHIALNLCVLTYLPNRRSWPDLSATYEGPQDVLEAHRTRCDLKKCKKHSGVITNDTQICGHVGSERHVDPTNPRVEIILTPHKELRQ